VIYFDDGTSLDSLNNFSEIRLAYEAYKVNPLDPYTSSTLFFGLAKDKYNDPLRRDMRIGRVIIANPMWDAEGVTRTFKSVQLLHGGSEGVIDDVTQKTSFLSGDSSGKMLVIDLKGQYSFLEV